MQLVPGELIAPADAGSSDGEHLTDDAISAKYARGEVRIVTEQARYSLKQIPDLVASADYNLQPSFQRRPRWSAEKQSRLVESFIMNVPVPPVFLYEAEYSKYEVMDGRQRLTAIADFYADRFKLEGLTEWHELNGRRYSTLPETVRRGIDRRYLSSIILLHETAHTGSEADRLKQLVFERINSGGEDLTSQEKRNALHPGPMNRMCIELARTPSFCDMWGIPQPEPGEELFSSSWTPPSELLGNEMFKHMGDAELVLRFFAHRQRVDLWRSGTRLDDFLTTYLIAANAFSSDTLEELKRIFKETCDVVYAVLGEEAFHLVRERGGEMTWVGRPTLLAYDPIMRACSLLLEEKRALISKGKQIRRSIARFYKQNYKAFDGRKTNLADIKLRDEITLEFFQQFAN